jgi:hypothetical protein
LVEELGAIGGVNRERGTEDDDEIGFVGERGWCGEEPGEQAYILNDLRFQVHFEIVNPAR